MPLPSLHDVDELLATSFFFSASAALKIPWNNMRFLRVEQNTLQIQVATEIFYYVGEKMIDDSKGNYFRFYSS